MSDLTTPQGVFDQIDAVQIVDVREPYEWDAGHIESAVHVPLSALMGGAGDFSTDIPVVVVCRSGNRSELAALMLKTRRLETFNLVGGMEEWEAAGLPFVGSDGSPGRVA